MKAHYFGSDFDDFLGQERLLPEVETVAARRMVTYQLSTLRREDYAAQPSQTHPTSQTMLDKLFEPNRRTH
jgi:hypothetical protein